MNSLEIERKVFDEHVESWRGPQMGKFVLIKNTKIVGFYDSLQDAFNAGAKLYGMEDFFVDQILPPNTVNISFVGQVA